MSTKRCAVGQNLDWSALRSGRMGGAYAAGRGREEADEERDKRHSTTVIPHAVQERALDKRSRRGPERGELSRVRCSLNTVTLARVGRLTRRGLSVPKGIEILRYRTELVVDPVPVVEPDGVKRWVLIACKSDPH